MAPQSSLSVYSRVQVLRSLQTLGWWCDHYLSPPLPPQPTYTRRIPAIVGKTPGSFNSHFYESLPSPNLVPLSSPSQDIPLLNPEAHERRPLLLNFHGGGYIIGSGLDDARFIASILKYTPNALCASVSYRLAPEYPFPVGIEDCVSSILWCWEHASELNIDPSLTALSGFSAGGCFCFSVCYRLQQEIERLRNEKKLTPEIERGRLVGIIAFYPALDKTLPWEEKSRLNTKSKSIGGIMKVFGSVFDTYVPPGTDLSNILISPGLASDEILNEMLPKEVLIMTCEDDALLAEGERLRNRLEGLGNGMEVSGYMVKGVPHGWDKWPTWWWSDSSRDKAYAFSGETLRNIWT
ncbi:Alpha/Beta hydrolase protein [Tricladium varicosporioides]|nr:Alpha/Beta hydrolase protein [Hymenoscyphus varicosporioides]